MKAVRKMKDFSIESILADTFIFEQTGRYENKFQCNFDDCDGTRENRDEKYSGTNLQLNAEEKLGMKKKNYIENIEEESRINIENCNESSEGRACIMNNLKKTYELCEKDNCEVNLRNTKIDVEENFEINYRKNCRELYTNLEQYDRNKICKNPDLFNNIDRACTITDSKLNLTIIDREKDIHAMKTDEETKEHKKGFKKFLPEEINLNCKEISKSNSGQNFKTHDRQKEDLLRHLKRDQKRKSDKGKRQLKKNQSEVLGNNKSIYLNENCNNKQSKYENKNFKDNLGVKLRSSKDKTENLDAMESIKQFEWLQFTRYKPPKIPRKPTMGKHKRKPSLHPRIPFSMFQLDFLEKKFRCSAYLTKNDVLDISVTLKLPPNRVKIWFQNRRARERREFNANIQ